MAFKVKVLMDTAQAEKAMTDLESHSTVALGGIAKGAAGLFIFETIAAHVGDLKDALIEAADASARVNNRLRVLHETEEKIAEVRSKLVSISTETFTSLEANVDLYAKATAANESLNLSEEQRLTLVKAVGQSLKLSAADGATSASVILQLSQGLGAGVVRGDEYRSIMEGNLELVKAVAGSLKVSTGQLKLMADAGELTGKVFAKGILQAADKLDAKFAKVLPTIGDSMQVMDTAWIEFVNAVESKLHVFEKLAGFMVTISKGTLDLINSRSFEEEMDQIEGITAEIERLENIMSALATVEQDGLMDKWRGLWGDSAAEEVGKMGVKIAELKAQKKDLDDYVKSGGKSGTKADGTVVREIAPVEGGKSPIDGSDISAKQELENSKLLKAALKDAEKLVDKKGRKTITYLDKQNALQTKMNELQAKGLLTTDTEAKLRAGIMSAAFLHEAEMQKAKDKANTKATAKAKIDKKDADRLAAEAIENANLQRDLALEIQEATGQISADEAARVQEMYKVNELLEAQKITLEQHAEWTDAIKSGDRERRAEFEQFKNEFKQGTKSMAIGMKNMWLEGASGAEIFGNVVGQVLNSIIDQLIQAAIEAAFLALFTGGSSTGGGFFTGLFKAEGGPVNGQQPYIVGEKGPELFVPNGSGHIVPNGEFGGSGGGGGTTNVNLTIQAMDSRSIIDNLEPIKGAIRGMIQSEAEIFGNQIES